LNQQISESLSGRVYIYNLLPLSISELSQSNLLCKDYYEQINKGFYPGLYDNRDLISKFYESYLLTYVERDLRFLKNIENIALFKKFLYLCATRIGQTITLTGLASDTGISSQTAKSWLSILEASFIIYNLPSYHNNLAKRSTKSSKLYFYDVGLASHIMGVNSQYIKDKREILGQLFENMIILDCLKQNINISYGYKLYFWRDSNLKEVDLILEKGLDVLPVEIKSIETINNKFFKNIFWFRDQLKIENKPALIYAGEENQPRTNVNVYRWKNCYFLFDNNQKK